MKSIEARGIGLCLSGGGMRGIAHLGVLQAMDEYGMSPELLSGTSAGAIIGAFYAAGYSPLETLEIARNSNVFSASKLSWRGGGWLSTENLTKLFSTYLPHDDFGVLRMPLYVTATNLTTGAVSTFSSGKLSTALLASASLPLVFPPVIVDGAMLLDGGVLNNLPIEPLVGKCAVLCGSHVNAPAPVSGSAGKRLEILERTFHLLMSNSVYMRADKCQVFFDPPGLTRYSMFNASKLGDIYKAGYEHACMVLAGYKDRDEAQ